MYVRARSYCALPTLAAYHRMEPVVSPIVKRQQGSLDTESAWCKANLNWVMQLLIRLREFPYQEATQANKLARAADGKFQRCFDENVLSRLSLYHICYWDEVHKQV